MYDKFSRTDKTIMFAFQRVLGRKSFDDVSVSDICSESDIQRMTFYNHFENKEHLFHIILTERQRFLMNLAQEKAKDGGFESFLNILIEETFDILENEKDRIKFFNNENKKFSKCLEMVTDSLIVSFKNIFKAYKDKIKLKAEPEICATLLSAGLFKLIQMWIDGKLNIERQEMVVIIKDSVLSAMVEYN